MDYSNMTLMEAILESGYPPQDIDHHESDLYVFVTKETTQVINDWFKQHNMVQTHMDRYWAAVMPLSTVVRKFTDLIANISDQTMRFKEA